MTALVSLYPKTSILLATVLSITLLHSAPLQAHAEHDKARFVATDGIDSGRCDKPLRPCRSIAYAVQHANKGDKVLIAAGHYQISDDDQLFLLTSELVPVLGGYNRFDHYQLQAPQLNPTLLSGVPAQFAQALEDRGFQVVQDGFARYSTALAGRLQAHQALQNNQPATSCVDGKAGVYSCNNVDLVAHLALSAFSGAPSAANDIWGHVDLNSGTEYAVIGLNNGTAVVSLAEPEQPVVVGVIAGSRTSWRDIKVYQYYDETMARWQAYAYVSSEGSDRIQIIDLNELPGKVSLAATNQAVTSAHNVYISGVDYTTNTANTDAEVLLHIVGQNVQRGAASAYSLSSATNPAARWTQTGATAADYTHDAASMLVQDSRADTDCGHSNCSVLFDFNEDSVRLWDISSVEAASRLSSFTYDSASYVHSGWWSEDKQYLYVHDELDEINHNLNTTLRIFTLDNLKSPQFAGSWQGPTKAIDHNGYVRGNRYYMSNYQRGLTILDISDADKPVEVGNFDTFVASDSAAFNGMWGTYPYLPSGLILGSDINSGLYIMRDNTVVTAGSATFSVAAQHVTPGEVATVTVKRPAGIGAVSVAYETFAGRAQAGTDFETVSGRISWDANDNSDKSFSVTTMDRGEAGQRSVFIRLFDPQNGLGLQSPSYQTLTFGENPPRPGSIGFTQSNMQVLETAGSVNIAVRRFAGNDGEVRVSYLLSGESATLDADIATSSGELVWADGDTTDKLISLQILDDSEQEQTETALLTLTSVSGSSLTEAAVLSIEILDDDANTAPTVSAGEARQVNAGATVQLTATASDAEGDSISYLWTQSSGSSVTLQNANSSAVSFVAPQSSGVLQFSVTATDSRGASSSASVNVTVVTVTTVPTPPAKSSGGSLGYIGFVLIFVAAVQRRWRLRGTIAA